MKNTVRALLALTFAASVLHAQTIQKIENICSPEDMEALGLTCSEQDPCPVFLEISSVEGFGATIFVSGNLHTVDTTLAALLLASTDTGKTWTEPAKRIRAAVLGRIQFTDPQHGWIAGGMLDPLPRGPFLLSSVNGGETWRQQPLSDEPLFGSIQQFWFETATTGQLLLDRSQGKKALYELYKTSDGGETWMLQQSSTEPLPLKNAKPVESASWRAVADKESYRVERKTTSGWETLARFAIRAGDCK